MSLLSDITTNKYINPVSLLAGFFYAEKGLEHFLFHAILPAERLGRKDAKLFMLSSNSSDFAPLRLFEKQKAFILLGTIA
jgi:hypothetical protein